jgi:hypothetical protein
MPLVMRERLHLDTRRTLEEFVLFSRRSALPFFTPCMFAGGVQRYVVRTA